MFFFHEAIPGWYAPLLSAYSSQIFSRVEPNYMCYESEKDLPLYFDMNRVLI